MDQPKYGIQGESSMTLTASGADVNYSVEDSQLPPELKDVEDAWANTQPTKS